MKIVLNHCFDEIISTYNLLEAWKEFVRGKEKKPDVQEFSFRLMDNILALNKYLLQGQYCHGGYTAFKINDPKLRDIHKACVRDRLLHHAIYRKLYPYFDTKFIYDSYSCRIDKGTHKAVRRFRQFAYKASENRTKTCWVLKSDIKKFFASVDHDILIAILKRFIKDEKLIALFEDIIDSHSSRLGVGLPLGNLTSQLLVNIYLNELDQFVKHKLKVKYYIRYADDLVILSQDREYLRDVVVEIGKFLGDRLGLELHPHKTTIETFSSGIDYLGYVIFPFHTILRTKTKKRMLKRVSEENLSSYLGLLSHCDGYGVKKKIITKVGPL